MNSISIISTKSIRIAASFLMATILFVGIAATASADTFYVSNSGNDFRDRATATNRNTPWKTIQRALNSAFPSDTVVVLRGTYYGHVRFPRSGRSGAPITLTTENRDDVQIIGSFLGEDISHIVVQGFDLSNRRTDGPTSKGISFNRTHHVTIRDNRVHDCRGGGISVDQSDWILIEWNIVHHNAFWDPGQHSGISVYQAQHRAEDSGAFGIIIRNNTCFANENKVNNVLFNRPTDGNGIAVDDSMNLDPSGNGVTYNRRTLVTNNFSYLNGGQGIHCYQSANVFVRNNTTYKNLRSFDFGGEVSISSSANCFVYNNVLFARDGKNVSLQFDSSNIWWDYNTLFNGPVFQANNGPNTTYSQPFLQPGTLRLQSRSPARDNGLTHTGLFPLDVDGQSRIVNGRIDRGAKEYSPSVDF